MRRGTLNSRFVRYLRDGNQGGDPPAGGGGGGAAGQGGNQNTGQGQQGGQGGDGGFDDLFDDADDDSGDGGAGNGNQGGQGGNQQQAFTQEQVTALGRMLESAMDRRINTLLRDRRKGRKQDPPANQGDGDGEQRARQPAAESVADRGAQREARLAFRDYVGDRVKFVSDVERQHAMRLGASEIGQWDGDGDPDQFGAQVAEQVGSSIAALRKHYRDLTIRQLRRRGALKDDDSGGRQQGDSSGGGFQLPRLTGLPAANPPGSGSGTAPKLPAPTKAAAAVQNAVALAAEYNEQAGYQTNQQ